MDRYVYLVCTPHSGSTLLGFLLGIHPEIATVGEIAGRTDYEEYPCSCGVRMLQCDFWKNIQCLAMKKGVNLNLKNFDIFVDQRRKYNIFDRLYDYYFPAKWMDEGRDYLLELSVGRRKHIEEAIMRNLLLSEIITDYMGKRIFLDTTKDLYRLKHLIKKLGKKLLVLYMVRDGRGVANSLVKREEKEYKDAIKAWIWSNNKISRILKNYCTNDQYFFLRYEDLCKNFENKIIEILNFIGVDPAIPIERFDPRDFHMIGNFMRKTFTGKIMLDEKWREDLTESQLVVFEKMAGHLNREIGYF